MPRSALLLDLVERLCEPLERILVGRRRAAAGGALHRQIGALAHGVDHARLLGDVLDPGAVVLRVHRELGGADLGGRIGAGLERIADDRPTPRSSRSRPDGWRRRHRTGRACGRPARSSWSSAWRARSRPSRRRARRYRRPSRRIGRARSAGRRPPPRPPASAPGAASRPAPAGHGCRCQRCGSDDRQCGRNDRHPDHRPTLRDDCSG